MRELSIEELNSVSGGQIGPEPDPDGRLPTVTVPGQRIYQDPWVISIDMDTIRNSGMSVGEYIFGPDYGNLIDQDARVAAFEAFWDGNDENPANCTTVTVNGQEYSYPSDWVLFNPQAGGPSGISPSDAVFLQTPDGDLVTSPWSGDSNEASHNALDESWWEISQLINAGGALQYAVPPVGIVVDGISAVGDAIHNPYVQPVEGESGHCSN